MPFLSKKYHRKSIRLREYDYSQCGFYFITICTHQYLPLFGSVYDGRMILNDAGQMIERVWQGLPDYLGTIELHDVVVMPNHFHGIIEIVNESAPIHERARTRDAPTDPGVGAPLVGAPKITIGNIVGAFKSLTTNEYIRGVKSNNWSRFDGGLWQRNYYEHIIRNEASYLKIAEYIQNNPLQWHLDKYHM